MKVWIPQPLLSYTRGQKLVEAEGITLAALLDDLDGRYPGLRFRIIDEQDGIRKHVRFFVNGEQTRGLETALVPSDEVHIFQALSGG
jgi:molybdopterin converting factor small subunit